MYSAFPKKKRGAGEKKNFFFREKKFVFFPCESPCASIKLEDLFEDDGGTALGDAEFAEGGGFDGEFSAEAAFLFFGFEEGAEMGEEGIAEFGQLAAEDDGVGIEEGYGETDFVGENFGGILNHVHDFGFPGAEEGEEIVIGEGAFHQLGCLSSQSFCAKAAFERGETGAVGVGNAAEFTGCAVAAAENFAVDHDTGADTSAAGQIDEIPVMFAGAVEQFGEGGGGSAVFQMNGEPGQFLEFTAEMSAGNVESFAVANFAGFCVDGTGNGDADTADAVVRLTAGELMDQFNRDIADGFKVILIFQHGRLADTAGEVAADAADHIIFTEINTDRAMSDVIELEENGAFAAG